tara:strand:- start:194 stop:1033 length:840 start_codon:yes stop_codon:yes gene_type:complete
MKNDDESIKRSVNSYRAMILFANKRTGSTSMINWFHKSHSKYVNYEKLYDLVESLNYKVNRDVETYNLFGKNGAFEDIDKQYELDQNFERVMNVVSVIMSYRPSHRIINEDTSSVVIECLIRHTNEYHSSILFLHRKKAVNRLLSLWYNLESGMSTPRDMSENKFNPKKFEAGPLDVEYLLSDQKKVNRVNSNTWRLLKKHKPRFVACSYEDMFESHEVSILHITFAWLFYRTWDFSEILNQGHMNLDKYYKEMIGIEELKEKVEILKRPVFGNMHVAV